MKKCKLSIIVSLIISNSGCMWHGDTPLSLGGDKFSTNTNGQTLNLPSNPWWKDIGSNELNSLVDKTLANNRKLSLAYKNIESAQAQLDTIKLSWLPILNFVAGRAQGNTTINLPNLPIPIANSGGFAAFLPIWIANVVQLPNKTYEAKKNIESVSADYLSVKLALISQTVVAYTTLLAANEEEKILAALKNNVETRYETLKAMTKSGISTEVSLNELNNELQNIKSQVSTNKANIVSAKNAISILTSTPIGTITTNEDFSTLLTKHIAPGNTPVSVLSTRPDVISARAKIEAADYGISSTASLFAPIPTFTTANARITSSNNGVDSGVNSNMQAGLALWTLDPTFLGMINSKGKTYDGSVINYLDTVENAFRDVDDNLASFTSNQEKLENEEASFKNSSTNIKTYLAMKNNGLISQSQYLEYLAKYELAKVAILQSKLNAIISLSKLYQSMGSGSTFGTNQYKLENQTIEIKD